MLTITGISEKHLMNQKKDESKKVKNHWPTRDAMEQVYNQNLWGNNDSEFYSGIGSHHPELVEPYIEAVVSFLTSFDTPLTVCDLGCGDFNVGKELVAYTRKYHAVDIVEHLIEHNKDRFKSDTLEFHCLDIASDDLPTGDCVLIRQVLQHLSNAEVQQVLSKLIDYKYVILTEHIPENKFIPNKDIISGQGIRLKKQSGINLLASPFNLSIKKEKQLLSLPAKPGNGLIVTTLYTMF